eukprot:scaffold648191_cov47-Prasinocladus_malaysianus.AAC.1
MLVGSSVAYHLAHLAGSFGDGGHEAARAAKGWVLEGLIGRHALVGLVDHKLQKWRWHRYIVRKED